MPTVLIVGASRGIGLELARQYAADGWRVYATCRDAGNPGALGEVSGLSLFSLDVRQAEDIAALRRDLGGTPIDVMIHNAGVFGPRNAGFGSLDTDAWQEVLRVNAIAPLKLAEALIDNVLAGDRKVMAFLSSRMGSISETSGGEYIYRTSKAALNAGVRSLAVDMGSRGLIAVMFHPGWVQTEMGGPGATVPPPQSVAGLRQVIAGLKPKDNGRFWNYDGEEIPW